MIKQILMRDSGNETAIIGQEGVGYNGCIASSSQFFQSTAHFSLENEIVQHIPNSVLFGLWQERAPFWGSFC